MVTTGKCKTWTLDWTMDWTVDSLLDWELDLVTPPKVNYSTTVNSLVVICDECTQL